MKTLPNNPTPTEVHVRLLTLMGWLFPSNGPIVSPDHFIYKSIPALDDNLLRSARERLLTTDELWASYAYGVTNGAKFSVWFSDMKIALSAPVLTHAIAICRAVEKESE